MRIFIYQANMVDNNKQSKSNQTETFITTVIHSHESYGCKAAFCTLAYPTLGFLYSF